MTPQTEQEHLRALSDLGLYVLDAGGNPIPEPDLKKWGEWFATGDRRIARTKIGDVLVSTVFLGLDHNHARLIFEEADQRPLLYETMIFWPGHSLDKKQDRYATRNEALAGHEAMVARVHAALARVHAALRSSD